MSTFPSRLSRLLFSSALLFALFGLPAAGSADDGVPVAVDSVRQQAIFREVRVTGSVTSPHVAQLSPATSGLVMRLLVDEGSQVEAGDLLLELDSEPAEYLWRAAEAQRKQVASELADAERRLREAQRLAPQQSIAETAVRSLEAEVAQDQAALDRASADAGYQHALLERHSLRAPFAGVISSKLTDPGEWINQGQGVLELVATEGLRLDFAVAGEYLAALTPDAPVEFSLQAHPGERFAGKVQTIVPVTDPGARTFLLRVAPGATDALLIPGMAAYASLRIPEREDGLTVPRDATLNYPDGRVLVWTVETGSDGQVARENVVQTGASFDGRVEILGGLQAGAQVVVQGNEALADGQRVRVVGGR
ncbi:efflux RND transporter periplasmic adaptor subunit [Haliea sp. E17]|uniref:efflux RND transporter periplasmic adaptor subunit n=1 Tax=Haliea sp. E17 TaxID=3401576 RepID=UPI003AAECABE